jgi:hypothetical protein
MLQYEAVKLHVSCVNAVEPMQLQQCVGSLLCS